jgi:NADH dehydrogenase FAD-containing subunit
MAGKIKNFMMRKLAERQLKNAPPEQKELIMTLMEKNPELLEKISKEMQAEIKAGKTQMSAALKVMPKYQKELQAIMGDKMQMRGGGSQFNPNGTLHK